MNHVKYNTKHKKQLDMKYIGQVEIERTEDIYEDTETGNVYKIVSEKINRNIPLGGLYID